MLSIRSAEGWRTIAPTDVVAIYRDDNDRAGEYVSAVLVLVGGEEVAGIVSDDALRRVEALIADLGDAA